MPPFVNARDVVNAIILSANVLVIGAFLIYGAKKRLTFLVDPPEWLWPFYGQALVKKVFGSSGGDSLYLFSWRSTRGGCKFGLTAESFYSRYRIGLDSTMNKGKR